MDRKETRDDALRRLLRIWTRSSSEEEFKIRLAAEGGADPLSTLLFRAYLFRKRHMSGFETAEFVLLGGGVFGFALWGGIAGRRNWAAGVCIMALAHTVMISLTLALGKFDLFCRRMNAAEECMK